MIIRRADASDSELILAIRTAAILSHPTTLWTQEELQRAADYCTLDKIAREMGNPDFEFHLADEVAVMATSKNKLHYLFVLPNKHNGGRGTKLLSLAEEIVAAKGFDTIELWTAEYADRFYLKYGYSKTTERAAPFRLEVAKFIKAL